MLCMSQEPDKLSLELSRSQGDGLDSNLPELHFIAGESAGLVTEDIFHLAQVLVQVAVACLGILPTCGVLHIAKSSVSGTCPGCCFNPPPMGDDALCVDQDHRPI